MRIQTATNEAACKGNTDGNIEFNEEKAGNVDVNIEVQEF